MRARQLRLTLDRRVCNAPPSDSPTGLTNLSTDCRKIDTPSANRKEPLKNALTTSARCHPNESRELRFDDRDLWLLLGLKSMLWMSTGMSAWSEVVMLLASVCSSASLIQMRMIMKPIRSLICESEFDCELYVKNILLQDAQRGRHQQQERDCE